MMEHKNYMLLTSIQAYQCGANALPGFSNNMYRYFKYFGLFGLNQGQNFQIFSFLQDQIDHRLILKKKGILHTYC